MVYSGEERQIIIFPGLTYREKQLFEERFKKFCESIDKDGVKQILDEFHSSMLKVVEVIKDRYGFWCKCSRCHRVFHISKDSDASFIVYFPKDYMVGGKGPLNFKCPECQKGYSII